jgi:hypothetical protein
VLAAKRRSILLIAVLAVLLSICIAVAKTATRKHIDVLFIGNSYTFFNEMPSVLEQLSASANNATHVRCSMIAPGGATLEMHWNDPKIRQTLKGRKWNFVVLQEQSMRPIENPERFGLYGGLLADEIKSTGAKALLYMTWSRKSAPKQQDTITKAYRTVGLENGCIVVPVGEAWRAVREENPEIELFANDGSHPTPAGSYLAACVFYAAITGKTPLGLPRTVDVKPEDASHLQAAARDALRRERA